MMWASQPQQGQQRQPTYFYQNQPLQQSLPPLHQITPQQPTMRHPSQPSYDGQRGSTSIPPSPRDDAPRAREEDYTDLPGPPAISHTHGNYTYVMSWEQQPVRARMCGFGDKDRRPISPPPCIHLVVLDSLTGYPIDPAKLDISFFVVQVDLWDKEGKNEKNLVRHAQVSPSISTATTAAYPHTAVSISHAMPHHFDQGGPMPAYSVNANTQSNTGYGYAQGSRFESTNYSSQGYSTPQNGYSGQHADGHSIPPISSFRSASLPSPYQQLRQNYQEELTSPQTTGMFTRNLIGSLTTNACLLRDPKKKLGIWFIFQDLSVRTEDWFRLKATFFNLGEPSNAGMPTDGQEQLVLTKTTVPTLAECFSKPFQVFSAKKFPGVIESTELSKEFAKQGVKIPIRKENTTNGGRRRSGDGDDDAQDDDEDGA